MSLAIISADQRLKTMTVKAQIWGGAGVGKTTLLKTLPPESTLAVCPEGGMLAVQKYDRHTGLGPYTGDHMEPNTWPEHLTVLNGFQANPRPPGLAKFRTVFIDSTSIISKHCWEWCVKQPEAFSQTKKNLDGTPALDTRGAYGLLRREMSAWAWGWKGIPDVNVFLIGGLEMKENDSKIKEWAPLVMGGISSELPYIFDYSLVMARFNHGDRTYTGLYSDPIANPEYASVPIKTRGGDLAPIEEPHLGKLLAKALGTSLLNVSTPPTVATPDGADTTNPALQAREAA